jgi:aryl-alcohol dehydrogenase-like predicted oxidoreductase
VSAPIIGTTRMEHLEEAVAALGVELSADQVRRLEEPYVPHPVLGHG